MDHPLHTAAEIGALLNITPRQVMALARRRAIPSFLIGRKTRRFDQRAVKDALASFEVKAIAARTNATLRVAGELPAQRRTAPANKFIPNNKTKKSQASSK